ncbi:unnamed protein product [Phaedon cochleariae]|uniref:RanBD1 domain-containing protein n=1 Tax=Phaedon cochleariae TaxID=80249 RepID=A0A9P0DN42_PHACE|nr:unnamed protein product [Phaedon cochleariae]
MAEPHKNDSIVKPAVLQQPPIIMKIDGPEDSEESNRKEIDDNEKNEDNVNNREFKVCSPSFRPQITAPNNPFAISQNRVSKSILKPPQFNLNNSVTAPNSKPFMLKPSQLNSVATKSDNCENINSDKHEIHSDKKVSHANGSDKPKFVPLIVPVNKTQQTITSTPNQSSSSSNAVNPSSAPFVFGENLHDRVMDAENKIEEPKASTSSSTNGTSEMLFSSALKPDTKAESIVKEVKSLSESAREYEESRASKRKYEEVEVITGEEDENNVMKICCKLFAFDKVNSSWQERGRGTLRLNDFQSDDHIASRLVFRTTGSLRVVLNTKVWAEMVVEKASEKSVRITALDPNGEIKVFLIMSNIEEATRLFSLLQTRLEREVYAQKCKKHLSSENRMEGN